MSNHPLLQLTLMRMREFLREPEAVFWSMIFPIAQEQSADTSDSPRSSALSSAGQVGTVGGATAAAVLAACRPAR